MGGSLWPLFLLVGCLIFGRGLRADSVQSLSSQGFHVLPNSIIKIEEALAKNATILFPPDMRSNQQSVHTCADNCLQLSKCNLFVFSKKTSKCVLFDCKEPSVCEFEDNHSMYVSAVRVKQKQEGDTASKSNQHAHKDCFPKFRCVTSAECIPLSYTCDRYIDCEDQSDELGCYSDYEADNDELSEYEKAYQKHTSSSSKSASSSKTASSSSHSKSTSSTSSKSRTSNRGNKHSSSSTSSESSESNGIPLSREAIPGSAEVRTGNEPRKVLQPIRTSSKSSSSSPENADTGPGSSDDEEPYNTYEDWSDYSSGEDLVDTEKPTIDAKSSRSGGQIDDDGSSKNKGKKFGKNDAANSGKGSSPDDVSVKTDVEAVSSHPMFDWLVGFVPEDRLSMMTLIEMYQLAESACLSVPESGICTRSVEVEYFYNVTEQKCHPRHFSICATGMNRFESHSACMAVCGAMKRSRVQEVQDGGSDETGEKEVKKSDSSFDQSSKDGNQLKGKTGTGQNVRNEQTSRKPESSSYERNDNYYQSSPSRNDNYRDRSYSEGTGSGSRSSDNSRYSSDPGDYYSSKSKQSNSRYYDSYLPSESASDSNRNSDWGYETPSRSSSRYHDEPSSPVVSSGRSKAGTSGNMRKEEPVYWEQFHHGSGTHNNVHGKTDPDDFDLQEFRLTVEQPALVNFDDDYSGSVDYGPDNYEGLEELSRGRNRNEDDSEPIKGDSIKKSPGNDRKDNDNKGADGFSDSDLHGTGEMPSDDGIAISAAVPLILGLSVFLLFTVLLSIRCYFWNRYPTAISRRRMNKFFKDKNDYLVDGMYL